MLSRCLFSCSLLDLSLFFSSVWLVLFLVPFWASGCFFGPFWASFWALSGLTLPEARFRRTTSQWHHVLQIVRLQIAMCCRSLLVSMCWFPAGFLSVGQSICGTDDVERWVILWLVAACFSVWVHDCCVGGGRRWAIMEKLTNLLRRAAKFTFLVRYGRFPVEFVFIRYPVS